MYPPPGKPEDDPQRYLLQDKLIDRLNRIEEYSNTLVVTCIYPVKRVSLGVRALKKQNGQYEFYLNLSRKTGIHPLKLMKQRIEALGVMSKQLIRQSYFVVSDDGMSESIKEIK